MGTAEDAERVVRTFCDAFDGRDAAALRPYFTDDVVYHNIPLDPAVGIDATIAFIDAFFAMCETRGLSRAARSSALSNRRSTMYQSPLTR